MPALDLLHDDLPLVIAEWELLSREEPWHIDPHRYGIDSLHEAIAAVLEVAKWGGTGSFASERLVRTAAAHGEQRRAQALPTTRSSGSITRFERHCGGSSSAPPRQDRRR